MKNMFEPAPEPEGKLRTVTRAIWALPAVKKLAVLVTVAALAKLGIAISPEVAAGLLTVADAVEAGL